MCLLKAVCFAFDCRRMAAYDPGKAINIVDDAILDNVTEDNRFLKPKGALLKRAANRFRSKN